MYNCTYNYLELIAVQGTEDGQELVGCGRT